MGLEDLRDKVKEEVNSLSEDEIKEHSDRVALHGQIIVIFDKRLEEANEKIEQLEARIERLEEQEGEESEDGGFLEDVEEGDTDDEDGYTWQ